MAKDTLALILLLGVMVLGADRRGAVGRRLQPPRGAGRARARRGRAAARSGRRSSASTPALRRTRQGQRLSEWLRASGGPLSPVDAVAIVLVGGLLLSLRAAARSRRRSVAFILGYVVVIAGMRWYVERARAKRRDAFMDQLPDVARMLSNGTQAGLSIAGAVQMAARELEDPAGAEMAAVVQEMRLGQPLDRALERLQERLPSREVAVLMTTIIIQQRAGGDTVRALQELGGTLEARKDLIREIRTVLSGSVFTSYIVAGIGITAIVLMNLFTPGVMREMTSSLPGCSRSAQPGRCGRSRSC